MVQYRYPISWGNHTDTLNIVALESTLVSLNWPFPEMLSNWVHYEIQLGLESSKSGRWSYEPSRATAAYVNFKCNSFNTSSLNIYSSRKELPHCLRSLKRLSLLAETGGVSILLLLRFQIIKPVSTTRCVIWCFHYAFAYILPNMITSSKMKLGLDSCSFTWFFSLPIYHVCRPVKTLVQKSCHRMHFWLKEKNRWSRSAQKVE